MRGDNSVMTSKEYRLYHYTNRLETIQRILENGFWPRFCAEDISWIVNEPRYLMVPLVSFCDITIQLSAEHQAAYGNYAIGMSKEWGKRNGISPLFYVHGDGPLALYLQKYQRALTRTPLRPDDFGDVWPLLPYIKPVTGYFPAGQHTERDYTGIKDFDEEMEWRYVPPNWKQSIYSINLYDGPARANASMQSEKTKESMHQFQPADIEVVVVNKEQERSILMHNNPELSGKTLIWDEIKLLE